MARTKRRRLAAAWAALFVVVITAVAIAVFGGETSSGVQARVAGLEQEVRCPSCGNLSVYNAKTASAYSIAGFIRREVAAGQSDQEIIDSLVASYGDTILMSPPASGVGLYLWVLPAVVAMGIGYEVYRSLGQNRVMEKPSRDEARDGSLARRRRLPKISKTFALWGGVVALAGLGGLAALAFLPGGGPAVGSELSAAETLASLGAVKPALQGFNQVLAKQPQNPSALAYKGWLQFNEATSQRDKSAALAVMSKAADLGPGDPQAQLFLGLALFYGRQEARQGAFYLDRFLADLPRHSLLAEAAPLARPVYAAAHWKIPAAFRVGSGVAVRVPKG